MRKIPEYAIRMQKGLFGERVGGFRSVEATFVRCWNNPADFRELIPEFYSACCDLYINVESMDLGLEEPTNDVELPLWARDASHFSEILSEALESDPVSSQLHLWIDLIFGCKQTGPAAEANNNLFSETTYRDSISWETVKSDYEKTAIRVLLREFGQCPIQIFSDPHPARAFRWALTVGHELPSQDATVRLRVKIEQLQGQLKALMDQHAREMKELAEEEKEEVDGIRTNHAAAVAKYREKLAVWEARRSEREAMLTSGQGLRRKGSGGFSKIGETSAGKYSTRDFGKTRTFDSLLAPSLLPKDPTISLLQKRMRSSATELPVPLTQTPLSTSRYKGARQSKVSTPPETRPIALAAYYNK